MEVGDAPARSLTWRLRLYPGDRNSYALCLSILIVVIGILRVLIVALHEPLLGYANNTDMIRVQACTQIWPADKTLKAGDWSPGAPISDYSLEDEPALQHLCMPASELVFVLPGKTLAKFFRVAPVPIHLFGLMRAVPLSLLAAWFAIFLVRRRRAMAALTHAIIWAVVVADPINTLYLNTFYTEFASVFFVYGTFILLWTNLEFGETKTRAALLGASLFLLGASRYQHLALPAAISAVLLVTGLGNLRRIKWTIVAACLGALAVLGFYICYQSLFPWTANYAYYIGYANATDTYLGAVLPAGDDPAMVAHALGLPAHCADAAGKTWYTPGLQDNHPCSEVLEVSRLQLLRLILMEPRLLHRMVIHSVPLLRPFVWTIGSVGGQEYGHAGQLVFTIGTVADAIPADALMVAAVLPPGVSLAVLVVALVRRPARSRAMLTLIGGLAVTCCTVFLASLLGDGYFEFSKHAHLCFSLWCSLVIVIFAGAFTRIRANR